MPSKMKSFHVTYVWNSMDRFDIFQILFSERLYLAISRATIFVKIGNSHSSLTNDFSITFLWPPNDIEYSGDLDKGSLLGHSNGELIGIWHMMVVDDLLVKKRLEVPFPPHLCLVSTNYQVYGLCLTFNLQVIWVLSFY